jgi:hypothetical protein
MDKNACPHNTLQFASGDYYIFCLDCIKYWCCNPKGDGALEGQNWNDGPGVTLSGTRLVKEGS